MFKKSILISLILFLSIFSAFADNISFNAGNTNVSFLGSEKEVELSGGANVKTDDVKIGASKIKISGDNFSNIVCQDNVSIIDYKHDISIFSTSLNYDRTQERIIIDGWVEMQDLGNNIAASSAWMEFDMKNGLLKMQIRAKILKDTSRGVMVCRADSIVFNRDSQTLILSGNSNINWNGDKYTADAIQVDLKKESVKMIGNIKGTVNG